MAKLSNQSSIPNISGVALKGKATKNARLSLGSSPTTVAIDIGTSGTLIHTATDYAFDEVFLWASNHDSTSDIEVQVEIGGTGTFSDPTKTFAIEIPKRTGLIQIYPGIPHKGVSIYAKAAQASKINIFGYVDRHYRLDLKDADLGYYAGSE